MKDATILMPLAALARRLSVPPDWLRDEAQAGPLPHLRAGRQILFDAKKIERLLLERARKEVPYAR